MRLSNHEWDCYSPSPRILSNFPTHFMSPQALALVTSVSYAGALICSRLGLRYSTPTTVTLVSILIQNLVLWTAVLFVSGIPPVSWVSVTLFVIV